MIDNIRLRPAHLLVILALLGLSFEAGRRYPFEFLNRLRPQPAVVTTPAWTLVSEPPAARYEASTAVWQHRLYLFGGFTNQSLEVTGRVDVFDPATGTWTRRNEMPHPATHQNAVVLGDTIWLVGGFEGDHPGPPTDRAWGYVPATDAWFEAPPLPVPRGGGVLAADGRRLHYYGGYSSNKTARAEHWMLDVDAWLAEGADWQPRAPVPRAKGHMTGAGLDGYLYAIGGAIPHDPHSVDVRGVHRYDPTTDTWSEVARLPFAFSHNEPGTFVREGKIWLVGGRSKPRATAARDILIYSPSGDHWMAWRPLPRGLLAPSARVFGDELFVAGGGTAGGDPEAEQNLWSTPIEPGWWQARASPEPMSGVAAGVVEDWMVTVGDGTRDTHVYQVSSGIWLSVRERGIAPRPLAGHHHAAEVLGSSLYLLGGFGEGAGNMQIFDVPANRWTLGPELPFRAGGSASALIDGKIYVGGGLDGTTTLGDAAVYDPATETWSSVAPMPHPRSHAASGTDGVRWYVFGGRGPGTGSADSATNGSSAVQIYDPVTDAWTVSGSGPDAPAPLPLGRSGMGAAYVDGRFFVIGGETAGSPGAEESRVHDRVDIYDPERNLWTEGPPLHTARHGILPVVFDRRILVAGGGAPGAAATRSLQVLDVPR